MGFLCCSEAEREGKGRERWGLDERRQHVHQRATYRTLASQRCCCCRSPFLLSPSFLLVFFFSFFLTSFSIWHFSASSFLLQFSRLLFLRCTPKMTPLILRSRSWQPPDQAQQLIKELCQWASKARTFPF